MKFAGQEALTIIAYGNTLDEACKKCEQDCKSRIVLDMQSGSTNESHRYYCRAVVSKHTPLNEG